MTIHCEPSDKNSIVSYQLGGQKQKIVKIKNAPIRIETKTLVRSVPPSEQVEGQLYNVNYTVTRPNYAETVTGTDIFRGRITGAGVNASENVGYSANNNWRYEFYITAQGFGQLSYFDEPTDLFISNAFGNPHGEITINWIAPLVNQESVCTIEIYYQNNRIYYDEGECPTAYNVICGDECPSGTTKCFSTNYPGYCCLPCSEIKAEIKAILSQVRRLNNG